MMNDEKKNHVAVRSVALWGVMITLALPPRESRAEPLAVAKLEDAPPRPRVLSAFSDEGGTLALGGAIFLDLPAAELRYRYRINERWSFDGQISNGGVTQWLRAGARLAISIDPHSALALRLSGFEAHGFAGDPQIAIGAGPGLLFSFDQGPVTWTAAIDAAVARFDVSRFLDPSAGVAVRPTFGAEIDVAEGVALVIEGGTLVSIFGDFVVALPVISALVAW